METMGNALKKDRKTKFLFILAKHRLLFERDSFIFSIWSAEIKLKTLNNCMEHMAWGE